MAQQIKIGVTSETSGATKGVENLDRAVEGLAGGLDNVARAADRVDAKLNKAARTAKDVADAAARIKQVQDTLARELGSPISESDAHIFSENFDRIRSGRGIGSQRVRTFNNFQSWYQGHSQTFRSAQSAQMHRATVLARGMQGTSWAASNPPPILPPTPAGGPAMQ